MSRNRPRHAAATLLALLLVARGVHAGDAAPSGRVIRYDHDTLTVRLSSVPMSEVLAELERQTGATVRGELSETRDVSAEFDDVPLPQALARLLGEQNFALVYGDGGRLRAVSLLPSGRAAGPRPVSPTPTSTVPPVQGISLEEFARILAEHPPIKVDGPLAAAVGGDMATFPQLLEIALSHDNPAVRMSAVGTGLRAIETTPDLRAKLVGVAAGMDPEQLSVLIQNAAGDRAQELASNVTGQTRATEVRAKFSAALHALRRQTLGGT
jgi:hypothetical protein